MLRHHHRSRAYVVIQRQEAEKAEAKRLEAEKAEAERLEAEKAEAERLEAEKAAAEDRACPHASDIQENSSLPLADLGPLLFYSRLALQDVPRARWSSLRHAVARCMSNRRAGPISTASGAKMESQVCVLACVYVCVRARVGAS